MSIIHEALKKVQEFNTQPAQPSPEIKKLRTLKMYSLYVTVFLLGGLVAKLAFNAVTSSFESKQEAAKPLAPTPAAAAAQPKAPLFSTRAPKQSPGFVLNGVFFSDGKAFALVNNKIVREGDTIEGADVVKITPEEVELSAGGEAVKLFTYNH